MGNSEKIIWTTERRKLADLIPWSRNPRQIKREQAKRLEGSIRKFGYSQLYEIEPDGTIIDGHQRDQIMSAMEEYGPDAVIEVRVASRKLTDQERKEYIALKHRGATGEFDWDVMQNLYEPQELLEWGFDAKELEMHGFEFAEEKPKEDPGPRVDKAAELLEKWQVRPGQLWQIGRHRLICGDCTDPAVVERVIGGEKASITFTSPPYNAGVSAHLSGNINIDDNLYKDEYNDNKSQDEYLKLLNEFTARALEVSQYVFVNIQFLSGNKRAFVDYLTVFRDKLADIAIWDKGHAAPQQALRVMDSRFEFILIFSHTATRAIGTREFRGMVHNVYEGSPQRHNEFSSVHAATFPVDFPEHFIKTFTNEGEIIFEPFNGTGTTLVACERLGRQGRGVEISSAYCAVTLERLAGMGLEPQLVEQ